MKERPILFSGPMVRAILAGTKTQTRRVVKERHIDAAPPVHFFQYLRENCPYDQPGDRLWVQEAFSGPHCMDASDGCKAVPAALGQPDLAGDLFPAIRQVIDQAMQEDKP